MGKKRNIHLLLLALVFSGAVCAAAAVQPLFADKWSLLIINNQALVMERFKQNKPYIHLDEKGTFSANMGCNQMHGSFTFSAPDVIEFNPNVVSTKMACDKFYMDLESEFIATLPKVKHYEIKDGKALNFLDGHKDTRMIFTNVLIY